MDQNLDKVEENFDNSNVKISSQKLVFSILALIFLFFLFFLSMEIMINSFKILSNNYVVSIFKNVNNPFIALLIGIVSTALIQSSSTTTAVTVALVASSTLSIDQAIPMIMGANIGTTITPILVSFAYIAKKKEFKKSFSTSILHNSFNLFTALLLFPLELYFSFVTKLSQYLASIFYNEHQSSMFNAFSIFKNISISITDFIHVFEFRNNLNYLILFISMLMFFACIKAFIYLFKSILNQNPYFDFNKIVFNYPLKSFLVGTGLAAAVHSSAAVISIMIPIVSTQKIKYKNIIPFIAGANVGTTFTAFTAAIFLNYSSITIACSHLIFNLIGSLVYLTIPYIKNIPILYSKFLGNIVSKNRVLSLVYIIFIFFIIPLCLILFSKSSQSIDNYKIITKNLITNKIVYQSLVKDYVTNLNHYSYKILSDSMGNNDFFVKELKTFRKGNNLFIDNEFYSLTKPGFCHDEIEQNVKIQTCLTDIKYNLKYIDGSVIDTCYIFIKSVPHSLDSNFSFEKIHIDLSKQLIFKREKFNKNQELIWIQEIIKQKNND